MMGTWMPETCRKRNKYIKQNCAPSWTYLQDYTGMHGHQNIKFSCSYYWSNRNLMGFRPTGCKLLPNHEQLRRSTLTSKINDALKHVFILLQGV